MEMNSIYLSYIFIGSALISLFLSVVALSNHKNSANKALSLLLTSVSVWSLFYGLEMSTDSAEKMRLYIILQYLGISMIPVFWLFFAAIYTGKDGWVNLRNKILVLIVPLTTIIAVVTDKSHHLFYKSSELIEYAGYHFHEFQAGPLYWLHIVYSYILVFTGIIMVVFTLLHVSKDNRIRVIFILLGSVIPYIFSLFYVLGIRLYGYVDLTPLGFLITGVLVTLGTFNKGLLDIKPLVLNSLFESIPDAIIVVDLNDEITSTNPKAIEMIENGGLNNDQLKKIIYSTSYLSDKNGSVDYLEIESLGKTYKVERNNICNSRKQKIGTMFMIIDITQEKIFRDALYRSEEQYRLLFQNAQEGIVVIQEMHLVFFNPMLEKLTGFSETELLGIHYARLIHPDDLPVIEKIYTKLASHELVEERLHFRLLGKTGTICWVEFSSVIIQWNGKQAGLLFVNNISEQKQAEELKELLISISNTYINAPIDFFDQTINNSLLEMGEFVNADRSYIFDYDWDKNVCNNTYEWCADGITAEIDNLQQIPLEYLPYWVETHKNNLPMYVDNVFELDTDSGLRQILEPQGIKSLLTIPMMNEGVCMGFVGFDSVNELHKYSDKEKVLLQVFAQMIVNLTNRKQANDLLKNQISVQQLINKISSDLVSVDNQNLDAKIRNILQQTGEFFQADRSYILRYSNNSTIETNTHEWCANDIGSQKDTIVNINLNAFPWWKQQVEKKDIIYLKDCSDLPTEAQIEKMEFERQGIKSLLCFPIINNNNLMGYFGFDSVKTNRTWSENQINVIETLSNIIGDALIKIETEVELIRSKELAEAASVAKSNFLSNMSHEIRTPLNGVIGFTELLRSTQLNKTQKEYLDNAISSANSLLGVISDILDFSKIESGKMELESIKTDIIQLFENSSDIIKVLASNKGLELLLNIHPDIPRFAYLDPIRTKQILVNLLSNAVKFTHSGEIELSLSFELKNNTSGVYKVRVRDTGIGIKEEDRSKLFKAFSQADTSTTRRYGGTGLGLIISNSLAQQMGGNIEFESEYGKGTTFYFDINCKFECGDAPDYSNIRNINNVLVIDDNANNRFILEQQFVFWNIGFTGIDNGHAAVELLEDGHDFDLIIVDYHMPEIDGLETIKLIREKLETSKDCQPIIMLHSSSDDLMLYEKAKELNVKFLLTKPVKKDELYYYLNSVLCDNNDSQSVYLKESFLDDEHSEIKNKEFCILVAEDTQMNMLVIGNMLRALMPNITMDEARNGIEAIQKIKTIQPDLILMDVQMPELDGWEATRQIRRLKNGLTVPIIALTAGVSKEERELCFKSGMDDFISKPIEKDELKRILHKYLIHNTIVASVIDPTFSTNEIHFDREKLISKIGNKDLMASLLTMSETEYPKYINEIKEAIATNIATDIKQKAHKLKGSALNMEFVKMGEIAKQIELNVNDSAELQKLINQLEIEWDLLLVEFKN